MKPQITNWKDISDGPLTKEAIIEKIEGLGYQCSCYTYPPGTFFDEHTHSVDKIDAVLKGRLKITLSGEEVILSPGDYIKVPKFLVHTAEVIGDEPVVSIDAIKYITD